MMNFIVGSQLVDQQEVGPMQRKAALRRTLVQLESWGRLLDSELPSNGLLIERNSLYSIMLCLHRLEPKPMLEG